MTIRINRQLRLIMTIRINRDLVDNDYQNQQGVSKVYYGRPIRLIMVINTIRENAEDAYRQLNHLIGISGQG